VSYDAVREEWGQVILIRKQQCAANAFEVVVCLTNLTHHLQLK